MVLHAAAVFTQEGVQLVTAGRTREALMRSLARYVERQATTMLWPEDALRLRGLLAGGQAAEAVALYFATVGERWEREFLKIEVVPEDEIAAGRAGDHPQHEPE